MSYRTRTQQEYGAGTDACSTLPSPEKPSPYEDNKKMPQVESATTRLASLSQSLLLKIGDFENILAPVLRHEPTGKGPGDRPSGNVPLADELNDISDKIEEALNRLQSMRERIEL